MYAFEKRSPASCDCVQPAAVRAARTRPPIPEAVLARGRPIERVGDDIGGSVPPRASLARPQEQARLDSKPGGQVEERRQRGQGATRFHLGDVRPGQWPAELGLAHPQGFPLGPDPAAEFDRQAEVGALTAMFSQT